MKDKIDDHYRRAEVFLHAVSSDEELSPSADDDTQKWDPKHIRKRISQLRVNSANLEKPSKVSLKKRVRKIIKKIKTEAINWEGYSKSAKNLVALHQLILEERVS